MSVKGFTKMPAFSIANHDPIWKSDGFTAEISEKEYNRIYFASYGSTENDRLANQRFERMIAEAKERIRQRRLKGAAK